MSDLFPCYCCGVSDEDVIKMSNGKLYCVACCKMLKGAHAAGAAIVREHEQKVLEKVLGINLSDEHISDNGHDCEFCGVRQGESHRSDCRMMVSWNDIMLEVDKERIRKAQIPKAYTIEEIKAAFWNMFHMSGEYWFEHRSSDERNSASTESFWKEFLEHIVEGSDDKS